MKVVVRDRFLTMRSTQCPTKICLSCGRKQNITRPNADNPASFTIQVDLRVGRIIRFGERYRLSLFAEGFNIFNRSNVQSVNNTLYAFSTATATLPIRLSTAATNFGTPHGFVSGSPSFTFNSSYTVNFNSVSDSIFRSVLKVEEIQLKFHRRNAKTQRN